MQLTTVHTLGVLFLAASLTACSSAPKPKAELALSNDALQQAENAGAREYAPVELRRAREKNEMALEAVSRDSMVTARRLSEQSQVDAKLAQAKANAQRSQAALSELSEGIDLMKEEILRVQGN